jgi:hypothetical protein
MTSRLFALERYDLGDEHRPEPDWVPATEGRIRVVGIVLLPADCVYLALVEGPDVETVTAAAMAAGWRIDRINPATWLGPPIPEQGKQA